MNCSIRNSGNIAAGFAGITFERAKATVVVKSVPASVCDNCGEAFIAEDVARKVHDVVQTELRKGIEIEVVHYAA